MLPTTLQLVRFDGAVAPLAGAAAGLARRSGLLVVVRDDAGGIGQGEASPLPGYSPDTIEECADQLGAVNFSALPAPGDEPAILWVARVLAAAGVRAPAASFALETALLDWLGRRRSVGIAEMLGGADAANRRVPLSALVADYGCACAAYQRGIRVFKLKVSPETFDEDVRLARALRAEFGAGVSLRFDANRRFAAAESLDRLRSLARFDPEFVEEPVAEMSALPARGVPVRLAADESLAAPGAWPALARTCGVVVLKPTLLGGLGACLRIAREAAARGLAATVTHTFDGPVALAAAAELAVALPGTVLACGLDLHRGLAAWPPVAIAQIRGDHVASARGPGLAVAPLADELTLARLARG